MKNKKSVAVITPAVEATNAESLVVALQTETGKAVLASVLDDMFAAGKWTIPDEAISGIYAGKINQMQAQYKSLFDLIKQLAAEVRGGQPPKVAGRVDALAAAKKK